MASRDEFRYRPPSADAIGFVVLGIIALDVALWLIFPDQRDFPLMLPILLVLGWLIWIVWAYPSIRVSDTEITSFNTWSTIRIPLTAIREVTGGKRLTITIDDGRTHIPAAVPGPPPFLQDAVRRTQTYGGFITPVSDVDRLRMDDRARTAATTIADIIQRRLDDLPPGSRGDARPAPASVANLFVIYGTIIVLGVSAVVFAVMRL